MTQKAKKENKTAKGTMVINPVDYSDNGYRIDYGMYAKGEIHKLVTKDGIGIDITRQGRQWGFTYQDKQYKDLNLSMLRDKLYHDKIDGITWNQVCKDNYAKAMQKTSNPILKKVWADGGFPEVTETPKLEAKATKKA
jgi:ABC-type oligopeptide transport system substrate-binding subunit